MLKNVKKVTGTKTFVNVEHKMFAFMFTVWSHVYPAMLIVINKNK